MSLKSSRPPGVDFAITFEGIDWLVSAYFSEKGRVFHKNLWRHAADKPSTMGWDRVLLKKRQQSLSSCSYTNR